MNVLHVISSLDPRSGGPAVAVAGLAQAQVQAGMQASIVTTSPSRDTARAAAPLLEHGIAVETISPTVGPLCRHPQLAAIVKQQVSRANIVHIHGLWEEVQHQAAIAAKRHGVPYLIRPCGMLDPWSLAQSRWKKRLYMAWRLRRNLNHASAIHFTTPIERDLTAPLRLKPPGIVEPNGVDPAEFLTLPPPGSFRAKYPLAQGRPLVLFMSRVHHKKGLDLLISAFARLRDQNAVLAIAGPEADGYRQTLDRLIAAAGIAPRVFFTGMLWGADRIAALADADLFVLPSHQENFGIAVVESLATGTPVIISDQVNIHPEVSAAGVGGVVPLQIDRLTAEVDRWLDDEPMRRAAGEKARAFALDRFAWRKIAARWGEHYSQIAASARG